MAPGVGSHSGEARFAETAWSMVLAAGDGSEPRAQTALAELCRSYWPPIYAWLRHMGYNRQDAQDITQSFFQHLLENKTLRRASRERGRFRSFLLGALKLCLADEQVRRRALKRGGGMEFLSTDALEAEELHHLRASEDAEPDEVLDRRWASLVLERALHRLSVEFATEGKGKTFEFFSPFLMGDPAPPSYDEIARQAGLSLPAVKSQIHRLRRQFATAVRREIMQTVSAPHEVEEEFRQLSEIVVRAGKRQAG